MTTHSLWINLIALYRKSFRAAQKTDQQEVLLHKMLEPGELEECD